MSNGKTWLPREETAVLNYIGAARGCSVSDQRALFNALCKKLHGRTKDAVTQKVARVRERESGKWSPVPSYQSCEHKVDLINETLMVWLVRLAVMSVILFATSLAAMVFLWMVVEGVI